MALPWPFINACRGREIGELGVGRAAGEITSNQLYVCRQEFTQQRVYMLTPNSHSRRQTLPTQTVAPKHPAARAVSAGPAQASMVP